MKDQARLAKARVSAYVRSSGDRVEVARSISDDKTAEKLRLVVKPPNPSSSLKKAGAVLLLTPDPFTAVPGTALIGMAYVMKRREPLSVESILRETRKTMRELQTIL